MFMGKESSFIRTTVYLPRSLHESAKIMAILTRTNLSHFMRVALSEKIKELKGKERGDIVKKARDGEPAPTPAPEK